MSNGGSEVSVSWSSGSSSSSTRNIPIVCTAASTGDNFHGILSRSEETNRLRTIRSCLTNLLHVDERRACGLSASPPPSLSPFSPVRTQILRRVTQTHIHTRTFMAQRHVRRAAVTDVCLLLFISPWLVYLESMKAPPRRSTLCSASGVGKKDFASSENHSALYRKGIDDGTALSTKSAVRRNWRVSNCSAIEDNTTRLFARESLGSTKIGLYDLRK